MALAVLVAAGLGRRLGVPGPKFELELAGKPLVLYSLEALQAAGSVGSIVLVAPAGRVREWRESVRLEPISKLMAIVEGGQSRQESVANGLAAAGEPGIALVHDAARPLVTPSLIDRVCDIPGGFDGVIPCVPVTDTVKQVEGGLVVATLDRDRLAAAQTPQAFRFEALKQAHEAAAADRFRGTDDASLVERAGGRVAVVEGSRDNIKVTYPEDVERARALLEGRSR